MLHQRPAPIDAVMVRRKYFGADCPSLSLRHWHRVSCHLPNRSLIMDEEGEAVNEEDEEEAQTTRKSF
jgi:hypothetical protein